MALIYCPNCGNAVSNQAVACPRCSFPISSVNVPFDTCKDCGAQLSGTEQFCPVCGCPVRKKKSSAKKAAILITAALLLFGIVAVTVFGVVIPGVLNEQRKQTYSSDLRSASYLMISGAADAEAAGNLIVSVWSNTIYEKADPETDPFTHSMGRGFNDDFNDSLSALFSDSSFQSKIKTIKDNRESVLKKMKALQNPPQGYEEAYAAAKDLYDAYLEFTSIVIDPTGSLNSFSDSFQSADSRTVKYYDTLELYLD